MAGKCPHVVGRHPVDIVALQVMLQVVVVSDEAPAQIHREKNKTVRPVYENYSRKTSKVDIKCRCFSFMGFLIYVSNRITELNLV